MHNNLDGTCFLVFSDDWGEHPSSCQHLFRHISQKYRVLWVNTIGMRNPKPTLSDIDKAYRKLSRMFQVRKTARSVKSQEHLLEACQPPMLPFSGAHIFRYINRQSVIKTVRRLLSKHGMRRPVFVATVPNACDYVGAFGESKIVYYCVDDFAEWPGIDKNLVQEMEIDLISKSDAFAATSEKLYNRLAVYGKPVQLLTHGVDLKFFSQLPPMEHILIQEIPKPRIGYFGLIDDRTDLDILHEVACRMPEISFVLTGRVEVDTVKLKDAPNIYFTGSVPYEELPAIVKGCDALILPYVLNELTESISPLKLKEYLATGKPCISSPIPEVLKLKDYVTVACSANDWEMSIQSHLNGEARNSKDSRYAFLENESWERKSELLIGLCTAA